MPVGEGLSREAFFLARGVIPLIQTRNDVVLATPTEVYPWVAWLIS
jgi:hypothetical protein